MMTDIHSHDPIVKHGQLKYFSIQLHPDTDFTTVMSALPSDIQISAGIHPWHASEWDSATISILETDLLHSRVLFIGEIGFDNACGIPFEDQLSVLESQLILAEKTRKVVLLHNVGYQSEIFYLKRNFKDIPAWIMHGFRGNAPMAEQFIRNGFYLSFGPKYQVEALRACPIDRLFIETDESNVDLRYLYLKIAEDLGITEDILEKSISKNLVFLGLK
jgi:TatD DNase family protein